MAKEEIKVGDVWESTKGKRKVRLTKIGKDGSLVNFVTLATKADGTCLMPGFVKSRKLIERDGKAVS